MDRYDLILNLEQACLHLKPVPRRAFSNPILLSNLSVVHVVPCLNLANVPVFSTGEHTLT